MERARRTGTKKQSREAVRAALRAAREGQARSDQWEAKEEKDVYEQVTEQEYADLVRKRRQNEDFVVDHEIFVLPPLPHEVGVLLLRDLFIHVFFLFCLPLVAARGAALSCRS